MENASKALIIAGAILLSILIISLGIMIFSQASEVVDSNAMSELEVTQFNAKFDQYTGEKVRGAQVNSLINQIVQHNVANQTDTSRQVSFKVDSAVTEWGGNKLTNAKKITQKTEAGTAKTGVVYKVTYITNTSTGLIDTITVSKAS